MKLPFAVGVKLVFRLLVPGFFLTLGLYPLLATIRDSAGSSLPYEYLFILSIVVTGWFVTVIDQPLYMLYEGRRYWPDGLKRWFVGKASKRLQKHIRDEEKYYRLKEQQPEPQKTASDRKYREASVEKRKFPINDRGQHFAPYPTRLGNVIYAFEAYPMSRYGMDAIFYWYRIWLKLDKDLREELDTRQALADSAVYASATLFTSALIWLIYWIVSSIKWPQLGLPPLGHLPAFAGPWAPIPFFLLFGFIFYYASLYAQTQYGETFKSVFDVYGRTLEISHVLNQVADVLEDSSVLSMSRRDQWHIAWRYLHNYTVKCLKAECKSLDPMSPHEYAEHFKITHKKSPAEVPPPSSSLKDEYYGWLLRAQHLQQSSLYLKVFDVLLSALVFGLGLYWHYGFFLLITLSGGVFLTSMILLKRQQSSLIKQMVAAEKEHDSRMIHAFEEMDDSWWQKPAVLLPHLLTIVGGLILYSLGLLGVLGAR